MRRDLAILTLLASATTFGNARADERIAPRLEPHALVDGSSIDTVEVVTPAGARATAWSALSTTPLPPGAYTLRATVAGGEGIHLEVPPCAGRGAVRVDGKRVDPSASATVGKSDGPLVVPLLPRPAEAHAIEIDVRVSSYEKRIACGYAPRFGARTESRDGFGVVTFASPAAAVARGGGHAVVFVPPHHDPKKPAAVLVGAHPWNGSPWTYAAYVELIAAAAKDDVVLLMPSGLGNSLYVETAEDEVLRAIDALGAVVAVDPSRVSIWGASMGGAGATTIATHRPDRFAFVASFFGDSKYDLATYVRSILVDEAGAHRVNALDVVDNARHLDVWLVHGTADKVSPIAQSTMLDTALRERGFRVRFDAVPKAGHEGPLVARFAAELVARAASARRVTSPERVTYRSVRKTDLGAYGVRLVRHGAEDAYVDVAREGGRVVVRRAEGVRAIELARGALGLERPLPIARASGVSDAVEVRFDDDFAKTSPGAAAASSGAAPSP